MIWNIFVVKNPILDIFYKDAVQGGHSPPPNVYIYCLWHNRARTGQLVIRASSRGVLGKIGAFFAHSGRLGSG